MTTIEVLEILDKAKKEITAGNSNVSISDLCDMIYAFAAERVVKDILENPLDVPMEKIDVVNPK